MDTRELHIQYITNEMGEKTAVILPFDEFQELLEDLSDLAMIAKRKDEPTTSHQQVVQDLKRDGLISD